MFQFQEALLPPQIQTLREDYSSFAQAALVALAEDYPYTNSKIEEEKCQVALL